MLIAEDLLLLLTDDETGRLSAPAAQVDAGLGGANLAELAMLGRVGLTGEGDAARPGRIVVRDPSPAGDEVLDAALRILTARQGSRPSAVIGPLSKHLRQTLYERLAGSGLIRAERGKILGVFPARRWPANDASHEASLRDQLAGALLGPAATAPDPRAAALIALMRALRREHQIVDPRQGGMSKRQLRERAGRIAAGNWAAEAVRKAINEDMMAAAGTTAATGG